MNAIHDISFWFCRFLFTQLRVRVWPWTIWNISIFPPSWPQEFHARNNVAVRRMTWSHYTCMCTVIGIRGISPCTVLYSHWAGIYMHCVTWIEGNGSEQSHLIRNEEEGRGESLHVAADPGLWCQHSLQISRHPSELCHQNGYKKLSCT